MKYKKISIEWIDSKSGQFGWEYLDDIEPVLPEIVHSVGFLIEDKKDYITIASCVSASQIYGRITIPKCSVIKKKKL